MKRKLYLSITHIIMAKCASGFMCFEERMIYLLAAAFLIVAFFVWKDYQRLSRIARDSITRIQKTWIPVNVPTRGPAPQYQQIGTLHEMNSPDDKRGQVLPLYGRQTYARSSKWMYYTMTDAHNMVQLPIHNARRKNCMNSYGCEELYADDVIYIDAYSGEFLVKLYEPLAPRYIPVV